MARKKQKPHRSGVVQGKNVTVGENSSQPAGTEPIADQVSDEKPNDKPYLVETDRASWCATEHSDVSEIVLTSLIVNPEFIGHELTQEFYEDSRFGLRFRLSNMNEHAGRMALGHWPICSAGDVYLEFVQKRVVLDDDMEKCAVIATGSFDGPNEGLLGLVHLVSMKLFTLRPVLGVKLSENTVSVRVRVEILDSAFSACESLLENGKQVWRKSMVNAMAWLRPEVATSEVCYGVKFGNDIQIEEDDDQKDARFDAARFYDAIKPSKTSPALEENVLNLIPTLRPYQRRAVHWMVSREKGASSFASVEKRKELLSPLCVAVKFLDTDSQLFYNPFSGSISLRPEDPPPYVSGGILADEMGLGKTVELLACIFAHQKTSSESCRFSEDVSGSSCNGNNNLKRVKRERVECICGAVTESYKYEGDWVQCDICDAWQHVDCVDYSATRRTRKSKADTAGKQDKNNKRKRKAPEVVETDDEFICQLCLELIEATKSPVFSGATLIVCPAPILPQWFAEIVRHTTPGSLRTCIYEGVRDTSLSNLSIVDVSELADADVVLTTYDVLKADLSHDSDRHEGDRRLMRYQKRYPVIPTPLTRIYWWRVCLDEAQMVESNASSATEMALRLHVVNRWCITGTPIQRKLDDLYGLIRFLKASPFDVSRWWTDVIRDPYEKGDSGAIKFTHDLFRQIMWRSSKLNVADELMLPPQEESLSWLSFSAVEEHFYQRQHETCVNIARELLANLKKDILKRDKGSSCDISDFVITHVEAAKLLNSLLKLRQACCHPQVGSSGLRSIQQSPMTMDEILSVLVSKTKVEGEDALRKVVSSLNGLAGIAVIQGEFAQAIELYKEALALAEEHAEDFRLDPLLNLHIHHNLSDLLNPSLSSLKSGSCTDAFDDKLLASCPVNECGKHVLKKRKLMDEAPSDLDRNCERTDGVKYDPFDNNLGCGNKREEFVSIEYSHESLLTACDSIKQKYLTPFYSRLSQAQNEFQKSYTQVCDASSNKNYQHTWWLEALQQIEQNQDSVNELRKRIENAVSGSRGASKSPRTAPHFRNISALMYFIQTRIDKLDESRKNLLDRVMEIDRTMENPRDDDVQRVRYCPKCFVNEDGPLCVHCELDDLFQGYEARLFLLRRDGDGRSVSSVEEALDLQKQKTELNQFYLNLANKSKTQSSSTNMDNEEIKRKGNMGKTLVVSRSPSELEVILGVLRSYFKPQLGREGLTAASKHLILLEGLRKEYAHARSLAIAQAQILRAYDEIKMATSRLRLRENVEDVSVDALSLEEIDVASAENSSEKYASLALLTRIKGKLRYLQGLMRSKQKIGYAEGVASALPNSSHTKDEKDGAKDYETCPVCQEKLKNQRMVFQCGHLTCCKCLVAMTEHMELVNRKAKDKWVMCPTCRQHSNFSSIALADDRKNDDSSSVQNLDTSEASVQVQGSYGTKLGAVTRRILWIKATEPNAKVLVFSSWKDVLDVLEHAFTANQISYVRMKGGRKAQDAISIFKGENSDSGKKAVAAKSKRGRSNKVEDEKSSVQVLMLLIQHGANGLNLLEAKHVILVEPLLNPAAEAQAISRVHRIGQGSKTLIHRFMVKGTVEESIYKLNQNKSHSSSSSFISGSKKNNDQPILTLRDIESLFSTTPSQSKNEEDNEIEMMNGGSLMHLPPSVAAAIAAERRLNESRTT